MYWLYFLPTVRVLSISMSISSVYSHIPGLKTDADPFSGVMNMTRIQCGCILPICRAAYLREASSYLQKTVVYHKSLSCGSNIASIHTAVFSAMISPCSGWVVSQGCGYRMITTYLDRNHGVYYLDL